ncbi:MAG: hypothetical protein H7175_16875 [Burkholderiales bacterium]|nr:hypothetical protein [Anaerolineae bacterium]
MATIAIDNEHELREALRFTVDDLAANREGRLSERQHTQLETGRRRGALLGGLFVVAFDLVAALLLFLALANGSAILNALGVATVICSAFLVGILVRNWQRVTADMQDDAVETVQGTLERIVKKIGRANVFVLRIGGQDIAVSEAVFRSFLHQTPYALHRSPRSKVLLSAEQMEAE